MSFRATPTFSDKYELLLNALMASENYHLGGTSKVREIVEDYLNDKHAKGLIPLTDKDFEILEIISFKEMLLRFMDILMEDSVLQSVIPQLLQGENPTSEDISNIAYVLNYNNIKVTREYISSLAGLTKDINKDTLG